MPNLYFDNYTDFDEQRLIDDLVAESHEIYGHTVYYMPREIISKDFVFTEDALSKYKQVYELDMYIKSWDSFQGDGTFLSKFNLEIRDQITFSVARQTFGIEISTLAPELQRPREGDLIYSTMMKRFFVIKFVNQQAIFYQLGDLQTWDLVCETWEYSNERFETGNDGIDAVERLSFANEPPHPTLTDDQYANTLGPFEQNRTFQQEANGLIDWTETDPFSEGNL